MTDLLLVVAVIKCLAISVLVFTGYPKLSIKRNLSAEGTQAQKYS